MPISIFCLVAASPVSPTRDSFFFAAMLMWRSHSRQGGQSPQRE